MIPDYDDDVGTGFEELLDDCGWDGEHCIDEGSEACNTCPLFALLHGSDPDSIDTTDYDPDEPTFEEKRHDARRHLQLCGVGILRLALSV